jgi:hypothetical protein
VRQALSLQLLAALLKVRHGSQLQSLAGQLQGFCCRASSPHPWLCMLCLLRQRSTLDRAAQRW